MQKQLHWFCTKCEQSTLDTGKLIYNLKARLDKVEEELRRAQISTEELENVFKNKRSQLEISNMLNARFAEYDKKN